MSKPWTDYELGFIQEHAEWTLQRIAEELGRTLGSVKQKRHLMRSGWTPTMPRWTKAEDDFMLSNPRMESGDVGHHLGRTANSVKGRRQWLKKSGTEQKFGGNWSPVKAGARPLLAKTCPDCGLLLQASWFGNNGSRFCVRCRFERNPRAISRKRGNPETKKKLQAITMPGATQSGQPWTESDFMVLADPDMTVLQKALTLHRTYSAAQNACFRGGYKSKVGLGDPERDQWMIDNPNADRFDEITASLAVEVREGPEVVYTPERAWDWDDSDLAVTA